MTVLYFGCLMNSSTCSKNLACLQSNSLQMYSACIKRRPSRPNMIPQLSLRPDGESWSVTIQPHYTTWKETILENAVCTLSVCVSQDHLTEFLFTVCCSVTKTMKWHTYGRDRGPHRCCPDNHCLRHTSSALGCSDCSCRQTPRAGTWVGARRRGWL